MFTTKVSLVAFAVCACLVAVQAAGGIKGGFRAQDSQQRASIKSPFRPLVQQQQQQQYLPPPPPAQALLPPPPPPQALLPPPPPPQAFLPPPRPLAPVKGPVFSAARVAPVAPPAPLAPAPIVQQQQQQEPEPEQQQVVQQKQDQQEEVDPSAAAQDNAPAVAAPARNLAAAAAASEEEANPRPEPYAFQYAFDSGDSATAGSSQREEQQDANGRVTGFYTLRGEDGRDRRVDYVADASGFRATVSTNELGTAPKDSADVDWNAQAPSDGQLRTAEAATQAARQRAFQEPQLALAGPLAGSLASASSLSGASRHSSPKAAGHHSSPRQNGGATAAASSQQLAASKTSLQAQPQQQFVQQLQEPFEQIRQVELSGRARKSRHAPFYLFTV